MKSFLKRMLQEEFIPENQIKSKIDTTELSQHLQNKLAELDIKNIWVCVEENSKESSPAFIYQLGNVGEFFCRRRDVYIPEATGNCLSDFCKNIHCKFYNVFHKRASHKKNRTRKPRISDVMFDIREELQQKGKLES